MCSRCSSEKTNSHDNHYSVRGLMYISNVEELIVRLRPELRNYLIKQLGKEADAKQFKCYVHDDNNPSMAYNPKDNEETVHCFSCGATHDIFAAASALENLPSGGSEWITETLPHLAEQLNVPIQLGKLSASEKEAIKLYKLAGDIANCLASNPANQPYLKQRGWSSDRLTIGSISVEDLKSQLLSLGWSTIDIFNSHMVETRRFQFFGENKVTFVIKDYRGKAIGFISRNIKETPKYINTPDTLIYSKSSALLGLDIALQEAKRHGLYIVEGPGDLAALHRVGIYNVVALCGTAFTSEHFSILKMLGVHQVYFSLDWDTAGATAIHRILTKELRLAPGLNCYVIESPEEDINDVSELLEKTNDATVFTSLKQTPMFEWALQFLSDKESPDRICTDMVPIIATETSAIRREMRIRTLSDYTGLSFQSILSDVETIRDGKVAERNKRVEGAVHKYSKEVASDPVNAKSLAAQHEYELEQIDQEYEKDSIGTSYQVSRFDAIQELKEMQDGSDGTEFVLKQFPNFLKAITGGLSHTSGALTYVGGRANSGKTAFVSAIGLDITLHDENAVTIMHYTDDSYTQVEPRLITNMAEMLRQPDEPFITIGMAANPQKTHTSKNSLAPVRTSKRKT
jgi:DNA primase catalytic core